jgi:hypothetical protein
MADGRDLDTDSFLGYLRSWGSRPDLHAPRVRNGTVTARAPRADSDPANPSQELRGGGVIPGGDAPPC